MNKLSLPTLALLLSTSLTCQAQGNDAAATHEHTLTGNLSLISDYRFRGITQTWALPAVQGGFDYAHKSGWYTGTWASNVSSNSYNNGAGLEMDLYGGLKLPVMGEATLDLGALAYVYPGARLNSAPGVTTDKRYDNLELYAGLSLGAFSGKLSYALTDYFGLNGDTAGYAYFSALDANGSSKGTLYLDLNYTLDLGQGLTLGAHVGRTEVRHYADLSYTDVKISLAKEMLGLNWTAALIATDARKALYQVGNAAGQDARRVGKAGLVFSVGKTF